MKWMVALLALGVGACSFTPVVPSKPPEGKLWRTQHQRYVYTQAQSTTQQVGNTAVTTTSVESKQNVIDDSSGEPREAQVLHAGMVATPEWFGPDGAPKRRRVSR